MDASRLLLALAAFLLALTQVPSAMERMALLDCQQRFVAVAKSKDSLVPAIAVRFCNGTSNGQEAF